MDVSIIIVNYNTFDLTCRCIESLQQKVKGVTFEIIVVDNASSEADPKAFLSLFPEIKLVLSEQNLGFAKGNNLGIANAEGEYVLLLNSDVELRNDAVTLVKHFLENHPEVGAASCRLEFPDGTVQNNCQSFPSARKTLYELFRFQKFLGPSFSAKVLMGPFFDYKTTAFPDWVWGTFFMFRKDLLNEMEDHKLADNFFMYVEDMQWCREIRKRGYRVAFVPEGVALHHMGRSGARRQSHIAKNMEYFMAKYYSSPHRLLIKILNRFL